MKSLSNIPLAYQRSWIEFFKLKFKVTPDVLIPRPETELLVNEVIAYAKRVEGSHSPIVLDIGTGSGNIAISLAKNLSHTRGVTIIATDISKKALKIAKQNARFHQVKNRITFLQSDLLNSIDTKFIDVIVANLPYIPHSRISKLDSSVKDFEPMLALDGGKDGFDLYRKLFQQIKKLSLTPSRCHLKMIITEIDDTQDKIAQKEAKKYFPKAKIEVKKDLFKRPRILIINLS